MHTRINPGEDLERRRAELVSPERLRAFFAPRSVALIGASDTMPWTRGVLAALRGHGLPGPIVPINRSGRPVDGIPSLTHPGELETPVDLGFVLVSTEAVETVLGEAADAGIRNLVVLAAGYSDGGGGTAGQLREDRLRRLAVDRNLTVMGPNCIGFLNTQARAAPMGMPVADVPAGGVGVVLQSGAMAAAAVGLAQTSRIGLSLVASMGNEVVLRTTDVIEYLIDDEHTAAIALFLESIREPRRFLDLARRAIAAGKPMVALKVGRSAAGERTALAHTGAVAGDDAVTDAVLRQHGVIRVAGMEELLVTAGLMTTRRWPGGRRAAVVASSGGACGIVADAAADQGIELPEFDRATLDTLTGLLPKFVRPANPLDQTGVVLATDPVGTRDAADPMLAAVTTDPHVDLVFDVLQVPSSPPAALGPLERRWSAIARSAASASVPVYPLNVVTVVRPPEVLDLLERLGLTPVPSIELGLAAVGHTLRWLDHRERLTGRPAAAAPPAPRPAVPAGTWSEHQGRRYLAEFGVPLVPAELVTAPGPAVQAATRLGFPVAAKVCSAQIAHKTELGAVRLGLGGPEEVRRAVADIERTVVRAGYRAEGTLIAPMRTGGLELLVGVRADATFGPVLAVGLGGVFVEVLADVALRVLPVTEPDILDMLDELRGAALLRGARGRPAVDRHRLASVIGRIADAALALGPALDTLEVNPLYVGAEQLEALDVLVTCRTPSAGR